IGDATVATRPGHLVLTIRVIEMDGVLFYRLSGERVCDTSGERTSLFLRRGLGNLGKRQSRKECEDTNRFQLHRRNNSRRFGSYQGTVAGPLIIRKDELSRRLRAYNAPRSRSFDL